MTEVNKNAVSLLKEYHDKIKVHKLPPEYTIEIGPGPKVNFIATCCYNNMSTKGEGLSKKEAQREAAILMLSKVKGYQCVIQNFTRAENLRTIERMSLVPPDVTLAGPVKQVTPAELQIVNKFLNTYTETNHFYRSLRDEYAQMQMSANYLDDVGLGLQKKNFKLLPNLCPVRQFENVMKQVGLKFCVSIPETKKESVIVALLKINLKGMVFGGLGPNETEATIDACRNALSALSVFSK